MIKFECDVPNVFKLDINEKIDHTQFTEVGTYFILTGTCDLMTLVVNPISKVLFPLELEKKNKLLSKIYNITEGYDPKKAHIVYNEFDQFKIEKDHFVSIMRFFRDVYDKHQSESAVLLLVNAEAKRFIPLFVVNFDISGGAVHYIQPTPDHTSARIQEVLKDEKLLAIHNQVMEDYNKLYEAGYRIYGTIHSHCNFNAFHSGVDQADEVKFDGLHITIGNVRSNWSYAQRYMMRGYEKKIESIEELLTCSIKEAEEAVDEWHLPDDFLDRAVKRVWNTNTYQGGTQQGLYNASKPYVHDGDYGEWGNDDIPPDVLERWKAYGDSRKQSQNGGASNQQATNMQAEAKRREKKTVVANMAELADKFEDDIWDEDDTVMIYDDTDRFSWYVRKDFYLVNKEMFDQAINLTVVQSDTARAIQNSTDLWDKD